MASLGSAQHNAPTRSRPVRSPQRWPDHRHKPGRTSDPSAELDAHDRCGSASETLVSEGFLALEAAHGSRPQSCSSGRFHRPVMRRQDGALNARDVADRVAFFDNGRIVECGPATQVAEPEGGAHASVLGGRTVTRGALLPVDEAGLARSGAGACGLNPALGRNPAHLRSARGRPRAQRHTADEVVCRWARRGARARPACQLVRDAGRARRNAGQVALVEVYSAPGALVKPLTDPPS